MIKIAHRGNTKGKRPNQENCIQYINEALSEGHYVEIDVWWFRGDLYLGHDSPVTRISLEFLENDKLVCHAKNIQALHTMLANPKIHCFWHENDAVTLTSRNWVWKYPEVYFNGELLGICSDWL